MQKWSYELANRMAKITPICTIAWGRSQMFLPFFIVYAFFRAISVFLSGRVQVIHIGDSLLSPLGVILRRLFAIPVVVTTHGLDMVFPNRIYQWLISRCLTRVDLVICVSEHTRRQCLDRGVPASKCKVILHGVDVEELASTSKHSPSDLNSIVGEDLTGKKVILSVGRLVKRKGVREFIVDALPQILKRRNDVHYLVVGQGPQRSLIKREIARLDLQEKVSLLGRVDEKALQALYDAADIVVLPNIPVKGDVEGFGIVALEACARGICVVAARLEGLQEAIKEGENGFLVEPGDSAAYADTIVRLLEDDQAREDFGARARDFVAKHNSWTRVGERYYMLFQKLCGARGTKLPSSEVLP